MERVPCAAAIITDGDGRILLVQRGRDPERGRWSVPGGKVEPGESFAEAAVREVREETGLDVEIGLELWRLDIPAPDGRVFDVHDFAATVTGGDLLASDDAADARWFAPDDLVRVPLTTGLLEYLARAGIITPDDH